MIRKMEPISFSGDTLFWGTCGSLCLPYSTPEELGSKACGTQKFKRVHLVLSGPRPNGTTSRISYSEKKSNPFLLCDSIGGFFEDGPTISFPEKQDNLIAYAQSLGLFASVSQRPTPFPDAESFL